MSVLLLALMIVMIRMPLQCARIRLPCSLAGHARVQANSQLIAGLFQPANSTSSPVGSRNSSSRSWIASASMDSAHPSDADLWMKLFRETHQYARSGRPWLSRDRYRVASTVRCMLSVSVVRAKDIVDQTLAREGRVLE